MSQIIPATKGSDWMSVCLKLSLNIYLRWVGLCVSGLHKLSAPFVNAHNNRTVSIQTCTSFRKRSWKGAKAQTLQPTWTWALRTVNASPAQTRWNMNLMLSTFSVLTKYLPSTVETFGLGMQQLHSVFPFLLQRKVWCCIHFFSSLKNVFC